MIVLWGLTGDGPFDRVHAALEQRGAPVVLIDQRQSLQTGARLRSGEALRAEVEVRGRRIALDEARAVYWRTYDARRLPSILEADDPGALPSAWAVEEALLIWLEMSEALVVNRPSAMASNGSKPYQVELLRRLGFDVPRTLITTDPAAVLEFWTDCSSVIYKSISGTRSIVSRLTEADIERLENTEWCPTQFQQQVPGRDHRVHVVGDDVFTCEVVSGADDYRYGARHGQPAELRTASLPPEIAERCVAATRALGLHLAGIDLRRAPDGRWFCFEVNPSPGFSYYESHTGQPIAAAIAALLARA